MSERYVVRTPFASRQEFVERFRRHFRDGGVFIPVAELPVLGQSFQLEVQLASGAVVLNAEAVVAWHREARPRGVGFRIDRAADAASEAMLAEFSPAAEIIQLAEIAKTVYERREVSAAWTGDRFAAVDRALDELMN